MGRVVWRSSAVWLVVFLLLAIGVTSSGSIQRLDREASESVYRALPLSWCEFLSWWGHDGLYLLGSVTIAGLLVKRQWVLVVFALIAASGGMVLQSVIKDLVARQRPIYPDMENPAHTYSFPSAHTLLSLIVYGLLVYLILRRVQDGTSRRWIVSAAAVWVALIGFSRVILGFHYLGDILGSLTLGIAWLGICTGLLERYRHSRTS